MFAKSDDVSRFRETPLGLGLSVASARQLIQVGQPRHWLKGHSICTQGSVAEFVYLVQQGRVSLTAARSDGEEAVIDVISAGGIFPLAPVLLHQPLPVGAQANTPVEALAIPAVALHRLIQSCPDIGMAVTQQIARHWQDMVSQNKALKLQNTNQRLAHFLLQHTDIDDGAVEVMLLDERRLLARRLGMTPESLSRAIAQLGSCGVEFYQQRVLIRDVDRLRQFCGLEVV